MHESSDRRSALQLLAAGAAAVGVAIHESAAALASEVDAQKKASNKPTHVFKGRLENIVYTPIGEGDTRNYIITANGEGGTMYDKRKSKKRQMSDAALAKYINKRNGGAMNGNQCLRVEGINWRMQTVSFDSSQNLWTMVARVCDSNPDARPTSVLAAGVGAEAAAPYTTCSCACTDDCYRCNNGLLICGFSWREACCDGDHCV